MLGGWGSRIYLARAPSLVATFKGISEGSMAAALILGVGDREWELCPELLLADHQQGGL